MGDDLTSKTHAITPDHIEEGLPSTGTFANIAEAVMVNLPQAECPVFHHFSPGLYIRELNMKAGTFAVGHRQKKEHLNIVLKGKVRMFNDDGTLTDIQAPMLFTGKPGRKAGFVLEDIVWLNVYPTTETDVETLEEMFLDKSTVWKESRFPLDDSRDEDIKDYFMALDEYGFDASTIRAQSEKSDDLVDFPQGTYRVAVFDSNIEGKGLFATAKINSGEIISPARINNMRTPAGRYTNHSKKPNSKLISIGNDDIYIQAITAIYGCHGGNKGEEITIDYRETMKVLRGEKCQE